MIRDADTMEVPTVYITNVILSETDLNIVKANALLATDCNDTFLTLAAVATIDRRTYSVM